MTPIPATPVPMHWRHEPKSLTEVPQIWLPRVLGIAPLAILSLGLLVAGGPRQGVWMVLLLLALCAGLLLFYGFISYSQTEKYSQDQRPLGLDTRQVLAPSVFAAPYRALTTALEPVRGGQEGSLFNFLLVALNWLYEGLTASPYPFAAFDLRYNYQQPGPRHQLFDITTDLIEKNDAIRSRQDFNHRYTLSITSINDIPLPSVLPDTWQLAVSGGCLHKAEAPPDTINSKPLLFTPDENFAGESKFTYTVTRTARVLSENQRQLAEFDSGSVSINVRGEEDQVSDTPPSPFLDRLFQGSIAWIQSFKEGANTLLRIRVQMAVVLATVVLFQTTQVKDVLLAMVLEPTRFSDYFLSATSVGITLSFLLWLTSRQLIRVYPLIERRRRGKSNLSLKREGIFSHEIELVLFWAGWISLTLFSTPITKEAFDISGQHWQLYLIKPYILYFLGCLLIWFWRAWDKPVPTLSTDFIFLFVILFTLGVSAPFLFSLIDQAALIPSLLGSVAILFWGMTLFLIIASTIFQFSIFSGFPLLTLLVLTCFLNGATRINDNHMIRLYPHPIDAKTALESVDQPITDAALVNRHLPSLETTFAAWLLQRRDQIAQYSPRQPYPVYVVSAQGGGIYAAYHSAKALAVLSEEVPNFSDHLFAISGVSGGSFGATIYAQALHTHPSDENNSQALSERVDHYFDRERDRLATILASMLFGDATQTIFPTPVAAWDRSLGLELAFENRREPEANQPIKLDASFYLTQDPEWSPDYTLPTPMRGDSRHAAPYLVLNTTEVRNGRRYILSPFRIPELLPAARPSSLPADGEVRADLKLSDADFHEPWLQRPTQMKPLDIRFSTAAALSARFPVVSSDGFFPESTFRRFVDGGLYDNSGAVTAREVIDGINAFLARFSQGQLAAGSPADREALQTLAKSIRVHPIAIVDQQAVNLDSSYASADVLAQRKPLRSLGWSPVDAILSTREARLQKTVDLLDRDPRVIAQTMDGPPLATHPRRVLLRKRFRLAGQAHPVFSIPLGWKLSCQSRSFINDQIQPMPTAPLSAPSPTAPLSAPARAPLSAPSRAPLIASSSGPRSAPPPWNSDGQIYNLLPCEQRAVNAAVKREPVRERTADPQRVSTPGAPGPAAPAAGEASLSRPFWCLIRQLREELAPPTA